MKPTLVSVVSPVYGCRGCLEDLTVDRVLGDRGATGDLMFTAQRGGRLWTGQFHERVWQPALNRAEASGFAKRPRIHDLRHSFAVGTLLRWYREGADPAARLLHLSTFLGHVDPSSTAVYLTITADLLQAAGERFERLAAPLS